MTPPFDMERLLLAASTFCYLLGFAWTLTSFCARRFRPARFNFFAISAGFLLQTIFLHMRGQQIGRCPITSLFEVIIFFCWSVALIYMVVGPTYRLSLMGAFTAPVIFLIQGLVLIALDSSVHAVAVPGVKPNAWLEVHAALSIIAYGAFLLAGIAGLMYLVQERQLKTHRLNSLFFHLPPIHELGLANRRLLLLGLALLSIGLGAGFFVGRPLDFVKVTWSFAIWAVYASILIAERIHKITPRRTALLSVGAFAFVFLTFWGISFIGDRPRAASLTSQHA